MLRYTLNLLYNLPSTTLNYIECLIIDLYKSILIIPEEEIQMNKLNENNIILTQPINQVN
jgi:hypothetical protein